MTIQNKKAKRRMKKVEMLLVKKAIHNENDSE